MLNLNKTIIANIIFLLTIIFPISCQAQSHENEDNNLYSILAAEISKNQGDIKTAAKLYSEAAKNSQDEKILRQATELSIEARDLTMARDNALLWAQLNPQNIEPQIVAITLSINLGAENIEYFLKNAILYNPTEAAEHLINIYEKMPNEAQNNLKTALAKINSVAGLETYAQITAIAGESELTSKLVQKILQQKPESTVGIELQAKLIHHNSGQADKALKYLEQQLAIYPKNADIRFFYANALMDHNYQKKAIKQLNILKQDQDYRGHALTTLGKIYLNNNQTKLADKFLKLSLEVPNYQPTAKYLLGQSSEAQNNLTQAIDWYTQVPSGELHVSSRLRAVWLLSQQNKYLEALEILSSTEPQNFLDQKNISITEVDLLVTLNQPEQALSKVNRTIELIPGDLDLLYARSTVATLLKDITQVEADTKIILSEEPDNANALNTLGYALAVLTNRYTEARNYITRALELKPDHPAYLDSLGWLEYKEGNLNQAQELLKSAYKRSQAADIAMHYGEVLWHAGDKKTAKKIFVSTLKSFPDNQQLHDTIRRLEPVLLTPELK